MWQSPYLEQRLWLSWRYKRAHPGDNYSLIICVFLVVCHRFRRQNTWEKCFLFKKTVSHQPYGREDNFHVGFFSGLFSEFTKLWHYKNMQHYYDCVGIKTTWRYPIVPIQVSFFKNGNNCYINCCSTLIRSLIKPTLTDGQVVILVLRCDRVELPEQTLLKSK